MKLPDDIDLSSDRGAKKWKMSMMLIEHRERISEWYRDHDRRTKPEFDEQYLQELAMKISEAKHEQCIVTVRIFDDFDDIVISGRITGFDQQLRRLRMTGKNGPTSAPLDDILTIEKA